MKPDEVEKSYTRSARKYDKILNFWFGKVLHIEKYRRDAVDWLELKEGDTVLDVGCGTGINFPLLKEKTGDEGKIIGLDYTKAMLKEAEKKIKKNHWKNITLIQGDAVHIDKLVNTKVDAIISTYCFSILYDIETVFLNALKVLKPNGRIVILDVKRMKPDNKLARILYPIYTAIARRYNIGSDEDFDQRSVGKKWELWQRITTENLANLKEKEFLLGIFFIFRGEKKEDSNNRATSYG